MTIPPVRLIAFFSSAVVHAGVLGAVLFSVDYAPPRIADTVGIEVEIMAELSGGEVENAARDPLDAAPSQAQKAEAAPARKPPVPVRQAKAETPMPPPPPQKPESLPVKEKVEEMAALVPAAGASVASEAAAKASEQGPSVAPRLLANPKPVYPKRARKQGIEGRVVLRVLIGTAGESLNVTMVESSGHALLDEAASHAVQKWRFVPAQRSGVPVTAALDIPIVFRIDGAN
ncbi:MAG: energy transducer TonB [Alphaproteobacteria bacterium]|nr:energy transducer TonB [Alphaproteobacteria bacterium]